RADRRQWNGLLDVFDSQPPAGPVADERLDQPAEVVDTQGHRFEALAGQLLQDDLEDGEALADRHERLRQCSGVRAQPDSLASSQNHRVHVLPSSPPYVVVHRYRRAWPRIGASAPSNSACRSRALPKNSAMSVYAESRGSHTVATANCPDTR